MENIMNSSVVLMTVLGVGAIILALQSQKSKNEKIESAKPEKPKKSVQLLTKDGILLYEYKDVYLTHWDKSIYFLSYEYEGKSFLRIDKGADMLLLVESYQDKNIKNEIECLNI